MQVQVGEWPVIEIEIEEGMREGEGESGISRLRVDTGDFFNCVDCNANRGS